MITSALLILQEQLCNKIIHAFLVETPQGAMFNLTPIWKDSVPCRLRIVELKISPKSKGHVLKVVCLDRNHNSNDVNEFHFSLSDPLQFVD